MLSLISVADVAAPSAAMPVRMPTGMGARIFSSSSVACGAVALLRDRSGEKSAPRKVDGLRATELPIQETTFASPQAGSWVGLFGSGSQAAGQASFARQQRTTKNHAHTTRIAAAGGGALGSHPARDPV